MAVRSQTRRWRLPKETDDGEGRVHRDAPSLPPAPLASVLQEAQFLLKFKPGKGEPPFSPTRLLWARKLEWQVGGWRGVSTRSSGKAMPVRAPHPTSRLLLIPDDGRKTQGRQGGRAPSPLARQRRVP